jgi:hypothetical protein
VFETVFETQRLATSWFAVCHLVAGAPQLQKLEPKEVGSIERATSDVGTSRHFVALLSLVAIGA